MCFLVTGKETGIATIRQRGADSMAVRSGAEARSVYKRRGRSRSRAEPTQDPESRELMQLDLGREAGPVGGRQAKDDAAAVPTLVTVINTED